MNRYSRLSDEAYKDDNNGGVAGLHTKAVIDEIVLVAVDMWSYYKSKPLTDQQIKKLDIAIRGVCDEHSGHTP